MSEIETRLRDLRDELHATLPVPDVDRITRKVKVRSALQAGVLVAVVAAVVTVFALALPGDQRAATRVPAPEFIVDFADADHGYAYTDSCREPDCAFELYATTDGGRTWRRRALPPPVDPKSSHFAANVYVLGPESIVIVQEAYRIHSDNGGRTWRDLTERFAAKVSSPVEPGGLLTGLCGPQPESDGDCGGLGTLDPRNGWTVHVPGQPPLDLMRAGPVAIEDGILWVAGRDRVTSAWSMAVSADRGRTWTTRPLDLDALPSVNGWAVTGHDDVLYTTATDSEHLLGVWVSEDRGRTWERTWDRRDSVPGIVGTPIAAHDGSLIVSDGATSFVSTDQGRSFERTGEQVAGTVTWTRAGYLRSAPGEYALSTDGLRWRTFRVG